VKIFCQWMLCLERDVASKNMNILLMLDQCETNSYIGRQIKQSEICIYLPNPKLLATSGSGCSMTTWNACTEAFCLLFFAGNRKEWTHD
jgi:hypothetical protein